MLTDNSVNGGTPTRTNTSQRSPPPSPDISPSLSATSSSSRKSKQSRWKRLHIASKFSWITDNWHWSKLKHVVRCAIAGWLAVVLFAIPAVQRWMGNAAFLILIASFFSPPNDAFVAVLERELLIILFVALAWAWSSLGIKFADMARRVHDPTVSFAQALDGQYIEAGPNVILGTWICLGSIFFLYIKGKQGPGPYTFACIFACICLDISLTTSVFFPFPYYDVGKTIIVPLALHTCIALACSVLIFPYTVSATFTARLQGVLTPLVSGIAMQRSLLSSEEWRPGTPAFSSIVADARATIDKSEAALVSVAAAGRLLENDLIYARFSPGDFRTFQQLGRRMNGRVHGLMSYFALIDPSRETFPTQSVPNTPAPGTPTVMSRHHSPERSSRRGRSSERHEKEKERERSRTRSPASFRIATPTTPPSTAVDGNLTPVQSSVSFSPLHQIQTGHSIFSSFGRTHGHGHSHSHSHHSHSHGHRHAHFPHLLQASLANLALKSKSRRSEHAVGVFESQQYLNLEAKRLFDPRSAEYTNQLMKHLGECCDPLLEQCEVGIVSVSDWLGTVRQGRWNLLRKARDKFEKQRLEKVHKIGEIREELNQRLFAFRNEARMKVLDLYRPAFEHALHTEDHDDEHHHDYEVPPHRHLFRCYVYQYHLMQVSEIVIETLDEIVRMEKERTRCRLWTPVKHIFSWSAHDVPEDYEHNDDDNPDIIQGTNPLAVGDLGLPVRRDPDALPPRNGLECVMNVIYKAMTSLWNGDSLFAIKAGIISVILCLPFLLQHSARWAYQNRWVWAVIMGQLTFARFRGDTAFGLFTRITATFIGGCIGMVMWYISAGNGMGNAYGLAIVCGVSFPFIYFVRLYSPLPPMTNIVMFVTAILVIGFSYQNNVLPGPANPGYGWDVAWKRFVLVVVGVTAAFCAAFLPPTMTLRRYQRHLLSTTSNELGAIYCSVVSYATDKKDYDIQSVISSLIATRSKLKRGQALSTNTIYEFSLRGRWPKNRYQQILNLQMQIAHFLTHLLSAIKHMEPAWTLAFLRRARFLDADFQGDVLAVASMISNSLRTGTPLPQITPCPLLDRFTMRHHGLEVIHRDSEEDFGLPRLLTMDTLQDEQYMMFCVAISTAFGIMNRLDKLMVATKELVGEQYHIHGIGGGVLERGGVPMTRINTQHFHPPKV